ncbi:hypothetical protein GA0115246_101611, partial [Streptomyces sp. SolWspMP-sol7th]
MVGEVGVGGGGQLGVGDEFDARYVDPHAFGEAAQGQIRLSQGERREAARAAHDHQGVRGVRVGEHVAEHGDAVVRRDRRDALPDQRLQHTEPLPHPGARPHRPLQCHAAAAGEVLAQPGDEVGHPVVGHGVVGLAPQSRAADDAAEGDEQPQFRRIDGREYGLQTGDLDGEGAAEARLVEVGERARLVAPRAVQDGRHGSQVLADPLDGRLDVAGRGDVGADVAEADARGGHAPEVGGEFAVGLGVGAAQQADGAPAAAGQVEGALRGDALTPARHEEDVVGGERQRPGFGGLRGQRAQYRDAAYALGVVVHLAEPGGRGDVRDDARSEVAGVGDVQGKGDHRGGDGRGLQVQGLRQPGGTPAVADRDEARGRSGGRERGPRGGEHQRDVLLVAVGREAEQDATAQPRGAETFG